MKNMVYGIGLFLGGSIGISSCIISVHFNEFILSDNIINKMSHCNMIIPFLIFLIITIIGAIISTKEFFNE